MEKCLLTCLPCGASSSQISQRANFFLQSVPTQPFHVFVHSCHSCIRAFVHSCIRAFVHSCIRAFMLNAPWRFHVGSNEFKLVGLLPIEYRVEQLMLGHMFNIINGNAPTYLTSGITMNQHRYSTRARELSCVIPRVKSSGLTSFMYQGVCHWNKLPLEIKQCPSKDTFKYQVKCLLYNRLLAQETSLYVRS